MPPSPLPLPLLVLLASLPLLVVLYLMIGRHWGGSEAGPAGLLTAVVISVLFFGAGPQLLLVAGAKALLLAFFVLYIIWMALLLYYTVSDAGAVAEIGRELPGVAQGKAAQALLLSWVFGAFLQGASGFGVPAAVVAPLLVGLGFAAGPAVVMALVGHAWAITYGSLGSAFVSLIAATGVPGSELAPAVSMLLGVVTLSCGLTVLWQVDGWAALRRRGAFVLLLTLVMAGSQGLIAHAGLYPLAALGGGMAGLLVAVPLLSRESRNKAIYAGGKATGQNNELLQAFIPYGILIAVVVIGQLFLKDFLSQIMVDPAFPEVCSRLDHCTSAGSGQAISVFGHGGALLFYATILIFLWYRWQGTLPSAPGPEYSGRAILSKTVRGSIKPTIAIYTLVAMAVIMDHTGMTQLLAGVVSRSGPFFPLLSPFIGALGAFMTGSNTNSNVVFGQLQKQTAEALRLSVPLILAAQTAGGAIGSSFAPAKVVVGISTVPAADEGAVLSALLRAGLIILTVIGVIVWAAAGLVT